MKMKIIFCQRRDGRAAVHANPSETAGRDDGISRVKNAHLAQQRPEELRQRRQRRRFSCRS